MMIHELAHDDIESSEPPPCPACCRARRPKEGTQCRRSTSPRSKSLGISTCTVEGIVASCSGVVTGKTNIKTVNSELKDPQKPQAPEPAQFELRFYLYLRRARTPASFSNFATAV